MKSAMTKSIGCKNDLLLLKMQIRSFTRLLCSLNENIALEFEGAGKVRARFENTPLDDDTDPVWISCEFDQLANEFFEAHDHQFWVLGGFLVTIISWLDDTALRYLDCKKHSDFALFVTKTCNQSPVMHKEPSMSKSITNLLADKQPDLCKRILNWRELRNRFTHSNGVVVSGELRSELSSILKVEFDPNCRMILTKTLCQHMLEDVESALMSIIKGVPLRETFNASSNFLS